MTSDRSPPVIAALSAFPYLLGQVERSIARQALRIVERTARFVPRPELVHVVDEHIHTCPGGLIALEGAPGSGTTALLCHLAATRRYAFWLPEDDAGAGLPALCAQLLALYDLPVPLVPPIAGRDATTLERLLGEAAARRPSSDPLVVLIDRPPEPSMAPAPPPLPAAIPPGVVLILACAPNESLPLPAGVRVSVPAADTQIRQRLEEAAVVLGCAPNLAGIVAAQSEGSFLYVRLAVGLIATGLLRAGALPAGLEALHQTWWQQLDAASRRLAALLAAAGEPIDPVLLATLAGRPVAEVQRRLQSWRPLLEWQDERITLYHPSTRAFVARQAGDELADAHAAYVALAQARSNGQFDRLSPSTDGYLVRQLARHIALSDPPTRAAAAPALASRAWIRARERHTGDLRDAALDAAWELRMAARDGPPLRLVRSAAIAGTLALLARTLSPDALTEAFIAALMREGAREGALKRVRELLDQLPDNRDKALALRQLGEVCYANRMRAPAMRMLSEALDLEAQGLPRAWRDERETTLVAFARAAIAIGAPDTALGITARIVHAERRGLIETEVVRWLLARSQLTRAEEVAYAIAHEGMHEWAMAEVAVGQARAGNAERAEEVLSTLKTETAIAWARGELACDAARGGDARAAEYVAALDSPALRDRALALVALALEAGGLPAPALAVARTIEDREVRARTLIDLAMRNPACAEPALPLAADDIGALAGEERAPLVAALAAAQAATGQLEAALQTAALLPEGEERDRAQSRIAVALARIGDQAAAQTIAMAIPDEDERGWALDELARLVAERGDWHTAFGLAALIGDPGQRARTEADLAIAWARAGDPVAAHHQAQQIAVSAEQMRAQIAIVGALVAVGGLPHALATLAAIPDPDARSRYQAALAAALAANGELVAAQGMARTTARPFDRARAFVAVARALAEHEPQQAHHALGEALRAAAPLGRTETFACLEWAADTLAALGGAELLLAAASALDEVDSWWG